MSINPILSEHILTLATTRFYLLMRPEETTSFRRFINLFIGADNDLFHNHKSKTDYHYRYPLVQYKVYDDNAALMGIAQSGVAALNSLLENTDFRERCTEWIGEQFAISEETTDTLTLHTTPLLSYRLSNYIALNATNLAEWHDHPTLLARTSLLEKCIVGHILKFASAIKWQLPPRSLQVQLLDYRSHTTRSFGNQFMAFDVLFRSNITLPEGIGLGKAVSHGFGIVMCAE